MTSHPSPSESSGPVPAPGNVPPAGPDTPGGTEVAPPPRWGIPTAIGSLLGFVVLSFAVSFGLSALGVDPVTATIIATPVGWLSLAGVPLLASRRRGNGPRSDLALWFRPVDVAIGLVACLVVLLAATLILLVTIAMTGGTPTSALGDVAGHAHAHWQVVALAVMALCAAFMEEIHFRGMWWSALRRRGLGARPTLLATAVLFALVHLEPTRVVLLFAAGLAAGYVRMRSDRLGPAIVTHLLINLLAAVSLLSLL
ncbi:type II CAAX endopeptidase family protein [Actinopolymorpha sp. NPDC004070]|uniref:CPBP family intramembrane glutamic endopeptidase n=1 Tax=Actinopolymorpha sp. NPDC004070 TaxID=3154548 RepID=UPI0033A8E255